MKSVSIKDLEKDWKVKPSDKSAIVGQIAVVKAAAAVALSLEHIKSSIDKVEFPEGDNQIEQMLESHHSMLVQLITTLQRPTEWTFDVQRNKQGFIDKVVVSG